MKVPTIAPNFVDRMVGYLSPEHGIKRLRARAGLAWLSGSNGGGGYDAGRSDKKALQRYNPLARSATADGHPGIGKMRARSRDQAMNNPLASGAINTTVTSSVGSGLVCQPAIDQEALGLTDEQADDWERQAQRIWSAWADTTECDIEDELTFGQLQSLAFRAVLESGDILRIRRFLWDSASAAPMGRYAFGTKVQLVEADRISNPSFTLDTATLQAGVQVDRDGRTVGYHTQTVHPGEQYFQRGASHWSFVPARDERTGQRLAQLLFDKRRPGQRRGIPYLAPVIESLKQLERYTEAELMAAVVSAMFTVFVTHEGGADASPLNGVEGDNETPETGSGDVFLGNGLVVDLAPDENVTTANPGRPNAAYDPFVLSILRQVGVGLELPFEILIKHFQSSYSASRGALLEAWKFYRGRRRFLVTGFCQPAYEDVIGEAVARGALKAPGFFENPLIQRAWLGTVWTGDAMPQIDPLKEAKASEKRIEIGISTIDREARGTTGTSFLENHRQRRRESRMRAEDGLSVVAAGPMPVADPEEGAETLLTAGGAP